MLAMANAPVSNERVSGGSAARTTGLRPDSQSMVVPMYEAIACASQSQPQLPLSSTCTYKASVVKLDSGWIFEDVAPPQIRPVGFLRVVAREKLVGRRGEASTHQRKLVVEETCIKPRNQGACIAASGANRMDT